MMKQESDYNSWAWYVRATGLLIAIGGLLSSAAPAQKPAKTKSDAQLEDALFNCLATRLGYEPNKRGDLRSAADHTQAFDQKTGRSFFWDKDKKAWRDAKTGESICPRNSTDASLEDALFNCLAIRLGYPPNKRGDLRSASDHTQAFDHKTGRSFFWDKELQAWRDAKTGECICPKCGDEPKRTTEGPNAGDVLKSITDHVQIGVGVGGGEDRHHHHSDDRRRADEKLTRDEKRLHGDEARKEEKHRAEEKVHDNRVMIAHDPQIQRAEEELERLQKEKAELERRHRETKDKDEKKMLERQIKGYDTLIEHEQAKLNQAR